MPSSSTERSNALRSNADNNLDFAALYDEEYLETAFYDVMFGRAIENENNSLNQVEQDIVNEVAIVMENSGSISSLVPPLPKQLIEITTALEDENTDFGEICEIIHKDLKLAGEVIKLANSPLYLRSSNPIDSLTQAIPLLGLDGITNIATTILTQRVLNIKPIYFKQFGSLIWDHSLECAIACRHLAKQESPCQAYFLGLIHDVGKVAIFKCLVDCIKRVDPDSKPGGQVFKQMMIDYSLWLSWRIAEEWQIQGAMITALKQHHQRTDTPSFLSTILSQSNMCSEIRMLVITKKLSFNEGKSKLEALNLNVKILTPIFKEIELVYKF